MIPTAKHLRSGSHWTAAGGDGRKAGKQEKEPEQSRSREKQKNLSGYEIVQTCEQKGG